MNKIIKPISILISRIISLLYPDFCIICDEYGVSICNICEPSLKRSKKQLATFSYAYYDYSDKKVQKIIKSVKYKNDINLAKNLAKNLKSKIDQIISISKKENIILLPIPIHKNRLATRGYNQSKIIAQSLLSVPNIDYKILICDALIKHKSTDNLYKSTSVTSRLESIRGSMILDKEKLESFREENKLNNINTIYIIIDDVSTTGATIYEAKRALLEANFKYVNHKIEGEYIYAITLAN